MEKSAPRCTLDKGKAKNEAVTTESRLGLEGWIAAHEAASIFADVLTRALVACGIYGGVKLSESSLTNFGNARLRPDQMQSQISC